MIPSPMYYSSQMHTINNNRHNSNCHSSHCLPKGGCQPMPIVNSCPPKRAVPTWKINYLVSNRVNRAAHQDTKLVNPWGIVIFMNQLWVVSAGSDVVLNYDLFGNRLLGPITTRAQDQMNSFPTGIGINCGGGFLTTNGNISKAAVFITCDEQGCIETYNPGVNPQSCSVVQNQQISNIVAVYKGLAIVNNILYLADFFQKKIIVFDSEFKQLTTYPFIDGDSSDPIPSDYGPNNIVNIGQYIYVIWAKQDPNVPVHAVDGPGNGYISVFNLDGSFVRRFTSKGVLNSPWDMIPAPLECGFPPGSFLVTNNGDGRINIFDCQGRYVGPMIGQNGLPITIAGIRGLAPHYTDFSEIFFTASEDEKFFGMVGSFVKDQVIYF